jgi:hypothetical protein
MQFVVLEESVVELQCYLDVFVMSSMQSCQCIHQQCRVLWDDGQRRMVYIFVVIQMEGWGEKLAERFAWSEPGVCSMILCSRFLRPKRYPKE